MLKTKVLHPEILSAIAGAGHLSKIVITDGNYPHSTRTNPRAKIVFANFTPGVLDAATLLELVCELVPIEAVEVMAPAKKGPYAMKNDPPIWADFRKILETKSEFRGKLTLLQKPEFNDSAKSEDVCLVIASAETQIYANIILVIGVVR